MVAAVAVTEGLATTANGAGTATHVATTADSLRPRQMCAISGGRHAPYDGERSLSSRQNARCRTNLRQLTVLIGLNGHCASGLRRHNMLADSEVHRALVVTAHPDDVDFGAGATMASWRQQGIEVTYCIVTDGDAGGFDPTVPARKFRASAGRNKRRPRLPVV